MRGAGAQPQMAAPEAAAPARVFRGPPRTGGSHTVREREKAREKRAVVGGEAERERGLDMWGAYILRRIASRLVSLCARQRRETDGERVA